MSEKIMTCHRVPPTMPSKAAPIVEMARRIAPGVLALLMLTSSAMTAANGAAPSRGEAMPFVLNSKFIEKNIEAKISLPSGAHVLSSYKRYYSTEQVVKGRKYIMGTFIHDAVGAGIQIVGPDEHPRVFDGGCDVISVRYSIASRRILSVRCNGVG